MPAKIEKIFAAGRLDTKIHSDSTTGKEKWLGYFLGPCLTAMVYSGVGGTYLTQFYTDVLGLSGVFLTLMPLLSKAVDVIMNLLIGRLIDHTRTRQGKARPWLLISGGLIAITGCLLYTVPRGSMAVQMVWIVVSYNLFFAFAYSIYNLSHALMVPLSTRDTKQRDTLAMFTSTGTPMIPGTLVTVIMPLLVPLLGVGGGSPGPLDGGDECDFHSGASGGSHGILFHKRACHGGTAGSDRRRDGLLCPADEGLLFQPLLAADYGNECADEPV